MADTLKVRESDALIACIDQETIDAGVACEIGMAFEQGIPIVGVYTDIRARRSGDGRMYKNLFVIGAVELRGGIVSDPPHLIARLDSLIGTPLRPYGAQSEVRQAIADIERGYDPPWSARDQILSTIVELGSTRVLDFGCGDARLANALGEGVNYLGFDSRKEAIADAERSVNHSRAKFVSTWSDVEAWASEMSVDLAIMSFCLHDIREKAETLVQLSKMLSSRGHLLVLDLSRNDLPHLTAHLRRKLLTPLNASDPRIGLEILPILSEIGFKVEILRAHTPQVVFPEPDALMAYLEAFGIMRGADLPLGINPGRSDEARALVENAVTDLSFPFKDQRIFLEVRCRLDSRR